MAKLRKGVAYRKLERPYTRRSKYKSKGYVRGNPKNKIVMYDQGNQRAEYPSKIVLRSNDDVQLRHNAIESARLTIGKHMERRVGKMNYKMRIRMYPHHVLRENPLAAGAGADRMSTGMKRSFGKPIGVAAQVVKGKELFEIHAEKNHVKHAKKALQRAKYKLPCSCTVQVK